MSGLRDVDPCFASLEEPVGLRVVILLFGVALAEHVPAAASGCQLDEPCLTICNRCDGPVLKEYAGVVLASYVGAHKGGPNGDVLELHLAPAGQK